MIELYQTSISFNSRRVWIALLEKGLEFETIEVQLNKGQQFAPEFIAINPFHHIPVLVDDGLSIVESLAILDYLEAKYPQPSLLPTDPADVAKVRMVEMVTVNELCPAMVPLYPKILQLGEGDPEKVSEAEQKINTVLQFLEGLLDDRPFFGSDTITLAEPVAGTVIPYLAAANLTLENFPKLQAWLDRLVQRPAWMTTTASPQMLADFRKILAERFAQPT